MPGRIGRSCARFSERVGDELPYDSLDALRAPHGCVAPVIRHDGQRRRARTWGDLRRRRARRVPSAFASPVENFYMTNPICRASETMAACVDQILNARTAGSERTGTDG